MQKKVFCIITTRKNIAR